MKSAWVEITGPEANKYITMMADIPEYTSDELNEKLTPSGKTKKAQLALVGMHIVGSAGQNRQMVWATFEHINNAPMATYPYMSTTSEQPKTADPKLREVAVFCTQLHGLAQCGPHACAECAHHQSP